MVTAALRIRLSLAAKSSPRGTALGIAPTLPIGVTPKQTSNLLYLRRMGPSIRSSTLLYRRAEEHFAFSVSRSSLTPVRPVLTARQTDTTLYRLAERFQAEMEHQVRETLHPRRTQCIIFSFIFLYLQPLA